MRKTGAAARSGLSDGDLLRALDLRDHDGLSSRAIAERLGCTRNKALAACRRVDADTEPGRHDGTMPRRWWTAGLRRRPAGGA